MVVLVRMPVHPVLVCGTFLGIADTICYFLCRHFMLRCKCPRLAVCHMQKTMVVMLLGSRWPTLLMQIALHAMWWNAAVRCVWAWICVVRAHLAVQAELVVKLRLICFQDCCSVAHYRTVCIPMTCDHNQICNINCTKSVCAYVCMYSSLLLRCIQNVFCVQTSFVKLTKAKMANMSCNQLLVDTAICNCSQSICLH